MKKRFVLLVASLAVLFLSGCMTSSLVNRENNPPISPSDGQAGTTLSAEVSANGFLQITKIYDWTLTKSASPTSLTLGTNESATVTYTLSAVRSLASQTESVGVRGTVCVTNGGDRITENLKIVVQVEYKTGAGQYQPLPGASQTILPATQLGPGATGCYDYEIAFTPVPGANYRVAAKVTITNHSGHLGIEFGPEPKADFCLPSVPTIIEIDESATLTDVQTHPTGFSFTQSATGPWSLSNSDTITFTKTITNISAACDSTFYLTNTATLTENDTNQTRTASATVTITTPPCPPQYYGCSLGYWKTHTSVWPSPYTTSTKLNTVFTIPSSYSTTIKNATFLQALNFAGGSTLDGAAQILLRQAVAAVLNAAKYGSNYPLSLTEIVSSVNSALASKNRSTILSLASLLDTYNNLGCK